MIRAVIGAVVLFLVFASSAAAQQAATGIQAVGTGTASAPANTAHLQFLLGSSASLGYAPIEFAPGTPGAEMPPDAMYGMPTLSEEQLDSVVAAITETGVASDAVVVTMPAVNNMFGPGGPPTAEIRVTIAQPQSGDLANLVAVVNDVAQQSGLSVFYVGARYEAADCDALVQEARVAAIADAQLRAEGLAQGLGVTLGELTLASEYPYYGPTGTDSCTLAGISESYGAYGPGTDPPFDPSATEVAVTIQVTLTYAFTEAA